ncbi:ABC-type phosphate transport system, ATPase component [Desulfosarcina cetonica]|nr:ABC-type phosphate transport system, ATPase component [Desulfosarcina cetonica]
MSTPRTPKIKVRDLSFAYGNRMVLRDLSLDVPEYRITAVVGASGQGKSTLLMVFNRLWEDIPHARLTGSVNIRLNGHERDIYHRSLALPDLRRQVGMVFQTPNPLPMSIYKNVAFPLKLAGGLTRAQIQAAVEKALKQAFLWDEVRHRLNDDARQLSGGQQQRLCMARALVLNPEVLLLDEPTSSLDAAATETIERLIMDLKQTCTIVMVSHDRAQVERVADGWVTLVDGRVAGR